jgi:hypothetical protein
MSNKDIEQIDELSKGTLGRYINKASNDASGHMYRAGKGIGSEEDEPEEIESNLDRAEKRERGIKRAVKKLTKEEIDESAGSETLKPNPTRAEMLATFSSLLAQLKGEDLSHFFNDSIKQYSADGVPSATAPGGAPAIGKMPMPTLNAVKEDINEVFDGEDLTEEAKEKFSTIFESAVSARVSIEEARLEEEFEAKLDEAVEEVKEEITTKVDQYLDYVVESWMEDNKLAIESTVRADIAENFMEGLYNLFAESYITVPEEKLDVVGELKAQLEELEAKLDESINTQLELQSVIDEATMEATFDEVSEGLAATQVEKLRTLAEGIEFTDSESYAKKLDILKGKYFSEKKEVNTGVISEEATEGLNEETKPKAVGEMANYVSAISRTKNF